MSNADRRDEERKEASFLAASRIYRSTPTSRAPFTATRLFRNNWQGPKRWLRDFSGCLLREDGTRLFTEGIHHPSETLCYVESR